MPRSRQRSSHSIARRCTCGCASNACTTLCSNGRPDVAATSSRWARSWRMSSVVSVTCCTPWFRAARTSANTRHVSSFIMSVGMGVPSQSRCTAAGPVGGSRWADQPQPPASIDSCSIFGELRVLLVGRHSPGLGVVEAEHGNQHRPDRDVGEHVDRLGGAIEAVEVLREGDPVPRHALLHRVVGDRLDPRHRLHCVLALIRLDRCEAESAVADRHRRDAVPTGQRAVRIPEDLGVVVGVEIDETGSDVHPRGVDHLGLRRSHRLAPSHRRRRRGCRDRLAPEGHRSRRRRGRP